LKRKAFLRELGQAGCSLDRHGKKHDLYLNPVTGRRAPVPRHAEIKDSLCDLIRRQLGLP
jgi:mRNA interferase HicA